MTLPARPSSVTPQYNDPHICAAGAGYCKTKNALPTDISETIVLAGNPNVGKSVIFNALTGLYTNVSNFPGTTVSIPSGLLPDNRLLKDTPGVYGVSNLSEEEMVAESAILEADKVINVISALSLERDLFLTQHLIDYQKPLLVVINQMDEALDKGIEIDIAKLEQYLGVPVIPTVAVTGDGLDKILPTLSHVAPGNPTPDCPDPENLRLLESDPVKRLHIYGLRRQHVNALVKQVLSREDSEQRRPSFSQILGRLFLNPIIGVLSGLLAMAALYQVVGVWISGDLVDITENKLMLGYVVPFIQNMLSLVLAKDTALYTILAGEFGVLTMSLQYIFGVLFPLILGFYVYISILEDCGYLPRIAVLCDGLLTKIGLNGRAVIPIILGFGCVTMATVSTRVLASQRERTIASTILAITIPCSAQIAVVVALMALAGGLKAWSIFIGMLFVVLVVLGTILNKMLPGKSTSLILDLPPMRMPSIKNIARKTWIRTLVFLKEAAPLFMIGSLLVSIMQVTGLLVSAEKLLAPLTVNFLHLPAESAKIFIMGMVRRDFGAAGLYFLSDAMTAGQILTALITIALFVPCIASFTVLWKERGVKESVALLMGSWLIAFVVGGVAARLIEWTGIL